jgi:dTDP-4-amino-4,6-dideoxygalactose transaminase
LKLPLFEPSQWQRAWHAELAAAFQRVLAGGQYILGEEVAHFEAEFAAYCGAARCVGVGNGLDALRLILRAAGIGPGDEVIVPAQTFVATWLAVSECGARPVGVDCEQGTLNLDARAVENAVGPRTRALIAVHLYGQPAAMDALREIGKRHRLLVVEDACQAHGAAHHGRRAGSLGDAAAFSFYPTKNLAALGDGGAVVTSDVALAERVRRLRNYGSTTKYAHAEQGTNSRLDELQAAFLRVGLAHLDASNARRRAIAERFDELLRDAEFLRIPVRVPDTEPAWHLYVVRIAERERVRQALRARAGIETGVHYPVIPPLQPAYSALGYRAEDFPVASASQHEVLSLPIRDTAACARVVQALRESA